MRKKFLKFFTNLSIFFIFIHLLPNVKFPSSEIGVIYISAFYALIVNISPFILGFFKIPKVIALQIAFGIALVFGYLHLLSNNFSNLIQFYPTYIGNSDLLFVKIPLLFELNSAESIFLFSSIILILCSIIVNKQIK